MNLIIDQGNSSAKVALFKDGEMVNLSIYEIFDQSAVEEILRENKISKAIYSSVIEDDDQWIDYLKGRFDNFVLLDEYVSLPIRIAYKTPNTLGKDRLAAVVGANYLQPDKDLLVIDAGTAITYELVEASGLYLGGNISPGMTMRFKALNHYTGKLPLVKEEEHIDLLGDSTASAIQAGVVNGIVYEMEGYINELRLKYPNLLVFLTGGHTFYFERRLKNRIFADINLVLIGLNRILEYNVEN